MLTAISKLTRSRSIRAILNNFIRPIGQNDTQQLKRVRGIEPLSLAWKARVLPLNYTRIFLALSLA